MKNVILLSATVFLFYSCNQESQELIEKDVTIRFNNGPGSITCGEFCGTTIKIVNGENYLKSKYELPDSITSKWEYWNREYIATIKFLNDTCYCKNGAAEPYPPGSTNFIEEKLKMVEILKISEKK
jgi:hypothetical protein